MLGDPLIVLIDLLNILYEKFGGHVNEKGFKVLDKHVRIIQGDGVNIQSIQDILDLIEKINFLPIIWSLVVVVRGFPYLDLSSKFSIYQ